MLLNSSCKHSENVFKEMAIWFCRLIFENRGVSKGSRKVKGAGIDEWAMDESIQVFIRACMYCVRLVTVCCSGVYSF